METAPQVTLVGITKRFGTVLANDGVSLTLEPGQVHALLGENGAGKSTLMSILAGLYRPDTGQILLNGQPVTFRSPSDALRAGIGMVYQHFMLVDALTVAENILLGARTTRLWIDRRRFTRELAAVSQRYRLPVDPDTPVWQLSLGERQRVEILRLLFYGARVLIFDEPTAVLTPQEADQLLQTLRSLPPVVSALFLSRISSVKSWPSQIRSPFSGVAVSSRPSLPRRLTGDSLLSSWLDMTSQCLSVRHRHLVLNCSKFGTCMSAMTVGALRSEASISWSTGVKSWVSPGSPATDNANLPRH